LKAELDLGVGERNLDGAFGVIQQLAQFRTVLRGTITPGICSAPAGSSSS